MRIREYGFRKETLLDIAQTMKRLLFFLPLLIFYALPLRAQEINAYEDAWYECYYDYAYSTDDDGEQSYNTSSEIYHIIVVNAYQEVFRFETLGENLEAAFDDPIPISVRDETGIYTDPDYHFAFSEDFSVFALSTDTGTDVFFLDFCEKMEEPLPFNSEELPESNWTKYLLYLLLAVLPAVLLMVFILWRDRLRPEPPKELILAFLLGLLTLPMAVFLEQLVREVGLCPLLYQNWWDYFKGAFIGAAIPEELSKLLILSVFFKWRKKQNEFMDGIVYAVCIGLAFAVGENIQYVLSASAMEAVSTESVAAATGVIRALTAVPCHFSLAVIMGFFYSFYLFIPGRKKLALALSFLVPVLFHGLYDFLAFTENIESVWSVVISYAFYAVFFYLASLGVKAIRAALKLDKSFVP